MKQEPLTLTRERLYEEVWSEPVQRVATRYGLSGTTLKKICVQLGVPVPPRGWWAKARAGHVTEPPRLAPPGPGELSTYTLARVDSIPVSGAVKAAFHGVAWPTVVVKPELTDPHPLVAASLSVLGPCRGGTREIRTRHACVDVNATAPRLERGLRIMDAVVKALEARGFVVFVTEPGPNRPSATGVKVGGIDVEFGIDEVDEYLEGTDSDLHAERLSLVIRNCSDGHKRSWRETEGVPLETKIPAFLAGLLRKAERAYAARTAHDLAEHEHEDHERDPTERASREDGSKTESTAARRDDLQRRLEAFETAERLRRFVDVVKRSAAALRGTPTAAASAWLEWARQVADDMERQALDVPGRDFDP